MISIQKLTHIAIVSTILSVIVAIITLFLPTPEGVHEFVFHSVSFITSLIVVTHFVGAWMLVLGLKGFSRELTHAYRVLVMGFVMMALGFIQLPLMLIPAVKTSIWTTHAFVAIPFLVSIVAIYWGLRGFARLFGVRNVLTSGWKATGVAFICSVVGMFVPHGAPNLPMEESVIRGVQFATVFPMMYTIWAAVLCFQARGRAGSLYIPATAWMAAYLAVVTMGSVLGYVIRLIQPGVNLVSDAGASYVFYAIGGFILLRAAIEFNKIRFGRETVLPPEAQTFFGNAKGANADEQHIATVLIYLAGLASDARAIDPLLDTMRKITAIAEVDKPLSETQQRELAEVYRQIATYLAEKESTRRFSREELETLVQTRFAQVLDENPVFARLILTHKETDKSSVAGAQA